MPLILAENCRDRLGMTTLECATENCYYNER
jgi:hypothetical protein